MAETETKSATYELKRSLLRRAWDGESRFTPAQIIAAINERHVRANALSQEHAVALARIDDEEPRTVRALNLLEQQHARQEGMTNHDGTLPYRQWTAKQNGGPPPPNVTIH